MLKKYNIYEKLLSSQEDLEQFKKDIKYKQIN